MGYCNYNNRGVKRDLDVRHNVDVTGDRGKARPKGADARGRPC
jgi:hypothetical protein